MWDAKASVMCIEHMASRWGRSAALIAITVLNEPSNRIPAAALAAYYVECYDAVRRHTAHATVVLPVYQRKFADLAAVDGFPPQRFGRGLRRDANVAFDLHLYHCFGEDAW